MTRRAGAHPSFPTSSERFLPRALILAGWMCVRFDNGQETDLELYQRAAKRLFGVSLSPATAQRYIAEFDLTWQMMGSRSDHKVQTKDELVQDALEWLQSYHKDGFGAVEPHKLWCIDGITDTEKRNRIWTYGKKNSDQRKCKTPKLAFTSTLLPLVNALGQQLGPAINTTNPDLDPDGKNGHNVRRFCQQLGLRSKDIYFVAGGKHYCKESLAGYSSFLRDTRPWDGHRILSDAARVFRVRGEDFFEEKGFEAHRTFVPSAHGQLSLIDGFINPWAKGGWRSSRKRFGTQWERTLVLAHEVVHVPPRDTAMAWENHHLVGSMPTYEQVEHLLFPKQGKNEARENLWDECVLAFEEFGPEPAWEDELWYLDAIDSRLDGRYWH